MPRIPRPVVPGQPLHLIQRGNNRVAAFVDDEDFARYLRVLRDASRRAKCAVHAYVLMRNHVHLLATPSDGRAPARMMQRVGSWYVRYFNERHGRSGTLWEGRYRSMLVDSERYFLECMRYGPRDGCVPRQAGIGAEALAGETAAWRGSSRCLVRPDTVGVDRGEPSSFFNKPDPLKLAP